MKKCALCKKILPDSNFNKSNKNGDGLWSYCRQCNNIKLSEWKRVNREKYLAKRREAAFRKREQERLLLHKQCVVCSCPLPKGKSKYCSLKHGQIQKRENLLSRYPDYWKKSWEKQKQNPDYKEYHRLVARKWFRKHNNVKKFLV